MRPEIERNILTIRKTNRSKAYEQICIYERIKCFGKIPISGIKCNG